MKNFTASNATINIDVDKIPGMSLRILLILIPTVFVPYFMIHGGDLREEISILSELMQRSLFAYMFRMVWVAIAFLIIVLLGVILHEAIHAFFFALFLSTGFQGVHFGFNKEYGIPFVHIKEPISIPGFRTGAIMPLIILGILPIVWGLFTGSLGFFTFGAIFTISASGDLLLLANTRGLPADQKIKDLPDEIGFELI